MLGWFYQYGRGVPKDVAQAISWYRKAADQGDFVSQNSLGQIYEYGDGGVEMRKETARCWYQKVAQSDNFF
jgi:TPR repeat protein